MRKYITFSPSFFHSTDLMSPLGLHVNFTLSPVLDFVSSSISISNLGLLDWDAENYIQVVVRMCTILNHLPKLSQILFNRSVIKDFDYLPAIWKSENKPMLCCFFFQTQHKFLYKKHLLKYMPANLQNFTVTNNNLSVIKTTKFQSQTAIFLYNDQLNKDQFLLVPIEVFISKTYHDCHKQPCLTCDG